MENKSVKDIDTENKCRYTLYIRKYVTTPTSRLIDKTSRSKTLHQFILYVHGKLSL